MQHFCFGSTFLTFILRYFDIIKLVCDVSPNFLFYCVCAIFAASSTPVSPLNRSMNRTRWFVLHFPSDNYFSLFPFIIYDRQTSIFNVARAVYFFGFFRHRCVCFGIHSICLHHVKDSIFLPQHTIVHDSELYTLKTLNNFNRYVFVFCIWLLSAVYVHDRWNRWKLWRTNRCWAQIMKNEWYKNTRCLFYQCSLTYTRNATALWWLINTRVQ